MKLDQRIWWLALTAALTFAVGAASVPTIASGSLHGQAPDPLRRISRTVILVAIDGVRWQDVFHGVEPPLAQRHRVPAAERQRPRELIPHLHRLGTAEGASVGAPGSGSVLAASGPNFISLPGYMEMLTGRRKPGCESNDCGIVAYSTVADDAARLAPGSAVVASWPGILRAASAVPGRVRISAGRLTGSDRVDFWRFPRAAHALRAGEGAAPAPGWGDFRPDRHTGELALATLDSEPPAFLFIGLGETDEYGHKNDYRAYLEALRDADALIGRLGERVARLNAAGHATTMLVTTDHGRAKDFKNHGAEHPESARAWLVASGAQIASRGAVRSPEPRSLADVGATVRYLLGLRASASSDAGQPLTELLAPPAAPPEPEVIAVR